MKHISVNKINTQMDEQIKVKVQVKFKVIECRIKIKKMEKLGFSHVLEHYLDG